MERYNLNSKNDFNGVVNDMAFSLSFEGEDEPKEYPCLMFACYSIDANKDDIYEIGFVYSSDFLK